jgi:hypothetical protein
MGAKVTMFSDYFERCRRKRNNIQYDQINVATRSEADELFRKATEFRKIVSDWLSKNHPELSPPNHEPT